jgi:hypothetical protein
MKNSPICLLKINNENDAFYQAGRRTKQTKKRKDPQLEKVEGFFC